MHVIRSYCLKKFLIISITQKKTKQYETVVWHTYIYIYMSHVVLPKKKLRHQKHQSDESLLVPESPLVNNPPDRSRWVQSRWPTNVGPLWIVRWVMLLDALASLGGFLTNKSCQDGPWRDEENFLKWKDNSAVTTCMDICDFQRCASLLEGV